MGPPIVQQEEGYGLVGDIDVDYQQKILQLGDINDKTYGVTSSTDDDALKIAMATDDIEVTNWETGNTNNDMVVTDLDWNLTSSSPDVMYAEKGYGRNQFSSNNNENGNYDNLDHLQSYKSNKNESLDLQSSEELRCGDELSNGSKSDSESESENEEEKKLRLKDADYEVGDDVA